VLLVETSGLSNPTNIDDILAQTKNVSGIGFDYRGCICLVDAVNFEKVYNTAGVVPDQIKQSSLAVINKTDLADEKKKKKIEGFIESLNPECEIRRAVYAEIPRNLFEELMPRPDRVLGGKQDLLTGSLCFKVTNKPGMETFRKLTDGIKSVVYRCKGYVSLSEGNFFIDGVMDNISFSRVEREHETGVVLLYKTSGRVKKTVQGLAAENRIEIEFA
jgi:G3E family GTPase